jgi:hypothetical protein
MACLLICNDRSVAESTEQPGTAKERPPFGGPPPAIVTPRPSDESILFDQFVLFLILADGQLDN